MCCVGRRSASLLELRCQYSVVEVDDIVKVGSLHRLIVLMFALFPNISNVYLILITTLTTQILLYITQLYF